MSAPDTDLEKQEKKHKGPLIGMGAAAGFGVVLLIVFVGYLVISGGAPSGSEDQVDGRTGAVVSQ
ncbi:hypothetical protein AAD018_013055 [Aestuariibius insulae]|uniref:hypothetical protein n=1 Tax=Aestuariibius insulae TaxID=2058287 RepID=UPI00345E8FDD